MKRTMLKNMNYLFIVFLLFGFLSPTALGAEPSIFVAKQFKIGVGESYTIPGTGLLVTLTSTDYVYPVDVQDSEQTGSTALYARMLSFTICETNHPVGTCGIYSGIFEGQTVNHESAEGYVLKLTAHVYNDDYAVFDYDIQYVSNKAPVITGIGGPQRLNLNEKGLWNINAYDPDGNYLSYSVDWGDVAVDGLMYPSQPTQQSTFQHSYNFPGTYTVRFTVTDEDGASSESTMTVNIEGVQQKYPDVAVTDINVNKDINVGEEVVFRITLKNVGDEVANGYGVKYMYGDGNVENFASLEKIAPGKKVLLTTKHKYYSAGQFLFKINVDSTNDFNTANNEKSVTIKVSELQNTPPVIDTVDGPSSLKVNEQGTWKIIAHDLDSKYLYYSVDWGEPRIVYSGAAMSDANQVISQESSFTHSYTNPGTYKIRFTVTDDKGASSESTMTVIVEAVQQKYPDITIADINVDKNLVVGQEAVFGITLKNVGDATANGYFIEYRYGDGSVENFVSTDKIAPGKKVTLTTKHNYYSAGQCAFKATAWTTNDVNLGNNEKSISVSVTDISHKSPVIDSIDGPMNLNINDQGTWKIIAHDPDSNYLTYNVDWGDINMYEPLGAEKSDSVMQTSTFTHTYSEPGVYKVTFTVSDNDGNTVKKTMNVNIGPKTWVEPPVIDKKTRLKELYQQLLKIIQEIISLQ